MDASDLDLRLAGTRDAILMVECGAIRGARGRDGRRRLEFGHKSIQPLIEAQVQDGQPRLGSRSESRPWTWLMRSFRAGSWSASRRR